MERRKQFAICAVVTLAVIVFSVGVFHRPVLRWLLIRSLDYGAKHFDPAKQPWVACDIPLPDSSYGVTFLQKRIHPFLAEYDYAVRFQTAALPGAERPLPTNTGGRTEMNVYWYPPHAGSGAYLRLQDKDGEYLVDFELGRTRRLLRIRGATYAGDLVDDVNSYGVIESNGIITVHCGDRTAEKVESGYETHPGIYVGRLDGQNSPLRFVPASEDSEKTIPIRFSLQ